MSIASECVGEFVRLQSETLVRGDKLLNLGLKAYALASLSVVSVLDLLLKLDYASASEAVVAEVARSADMPMKPWIELPNNNIPAINRWFWECSRRDVPLVYIETRQKYAKLTWDCITVQSKSIDASLNGSGGDNLGEIIFRAFQHLAKPDPGHAEFFGKAFVGTIDRLTFDAARTVADGY